MHIVDKARYALASATVCILYIYSTSILELGTVLVLYVCTVIFFTPLPLDCVYIYKLYILYLQIQ